MSTEITNQVVISEPRRRLCSQVLHNLPVTQYKNPGTMCVRFIWQLSQKEEQTMYICMEQQQILVQKQGRNSYPHIWRHGKMF